METQKRQTVKPHTYALAAALCAALLVLASCGGLFALEAGGKTGTGTLVVKLPSVSPRATDIDADADSLFTVKVTKDATVKFNQSDVAPGTEIPVTGLEPGKYTVSVEAYLKDVEPVSAEPYAETANAQRETATYTILSGSGSSEVTVTAGGKTRAPVELKKCGAALLRAELYDNNGESTPVSGTATITYPMWNHNQDVSGQGHNGEHENFITIENAEFDENGTYVLQGLPIGDAIIWFEVELSAGSDVHHGFEEAQQITWGGLTEARVEIYE